LNRARLPRSVRSLWTAELGGLARDSVYVGAGQAAISIADLVQIILVTHLLGLTEYGRLALTVTVVALVGQFFDVRVGPAVTTFGARKMNHGIRTAGGVFQFGYVIDGVTGLLGFAAVAAVAPFFGPHLVGGDGTELIVLYGLTILVSTLDETSVSILRLLDRFRLITFYTIGVETLRIVFVAGGLMLSRSLLSVILALLLYELIGAIAIAAFAGASFRVESGGTRLTTLAIRTVAEDTRPMMKMVLHTNVVSYGRLAQVQLPAVLLGALSGVTQVAVYKIATAAAAGIGRLTDPAFAALLPRLSRLWIEQRRAEIQRLIRSATLIASAAMATMLVLFVVLRFPIINLLGGEDVPRSAGTVLILVAVAQVVNGIVFWNYPLLYASGRAGRVARIALLGGFVQIAAMLVLIPVFDAIGAATALLLSQIVVNAAATIYASRCLHVPRAGSGQHARPVTSADPASTKPRSEVDVG
jgi:O-antigen/teichoic acid export membrane protein